MAAVLACRPSVVSHISAAWLWGLLRTRPGTIHLTAPTQRHPRPGFVVHCARLSAEDIKVEAGLPVTSLPRTYLDLAADFSDVRLERLLERGEELKRFDLAAVDDVLTRAGGHPGAGRLRRALDIYRPEPAFTRSGVERRFLDLARKAGLPLPATNFNVGGFELDTYWAAERFAVELDVYETHGTRAAFERDRLRQDDLMLIGVGMIRVTGPRLDREPGATIERVASHLRRRRAGAPATETSATRRPGDG